MTSPGTTQRAGLQEGSRALTAIAADEPQGLGDPIGRPWPRDRGDGSAQDFASYALTPHRGLPAPGIWAAAPPQSCQGGAPSLSAPESRAMGRGVRAVAKRYRGFADGAPHCPTGACAIVPYGLVEGPDPGRPHKHCNAQYSRQGRMC